MLGRIGSSHAKEEDDGWSGGRKLDEEGGGVVVERVNDKVTAE